jgi:hypothetical protein
LVEKIEPVSKPFSLSKVKVRAVFNQRVYLRISMELILAQGAEVGQNGLAQWKMFD